MDAQMTVEDSAGLVALVQSLVHMEATEDAADGASHGSAELLAENRFLAARDGMQAHFLDPGLEGQISAHDVLCTTLDACAPARRRVGLPRRARARPRAEPAARGRAPARTRARSARTRRPGRGAGRRLLMCGLGGEVAWGRAPDLDALGRIGDALAPRGPDGAGAWHESGVALVHRRLKIIDLSRARRPADGRPRAGPRDRVQRLHLQPPRAARRARARPATRFARPRDTEVILKAFHHWGASASSIT